MKTRRVVVTGIGALTPIGNNLEEYWNNLKNGVSGASNITLFDATNFKTKFACEVKGFDPLDYLDRKESRKMDRFTQLGMAATSQAIEAAGLDLEKINLERSGVIWGSGIGGLKTFFDESVNFEKNNQIPRFNPFFIPKMISDIIAGHISIKYGFKGPNYTTVSACASSSHAIIDSFNLIKWGKSDLFITGGSEAAVNEPGVGGFNAMMALSRRNEDPKTASRPFDKNRDGFVLGEGSGTLVLEDLEHAIDRGAKIYAEIVGTGMTADAHHITAPHPEGQGAKRVMEEAILEAGLKPEDVNYVNVHGTSTPLGDVAEIKALESLLKEHVYNINVSSTKSMTGHLLGAAGAIESIASIMAVKHNVVPPTINHTTHDPEINSKIELTLNKKQEKEINTAISNTFGFGGHNASILFKKYTE